MIDKTHLLPYFASQAPKSPKGDLQSPPSEGGGQPIPLGGRRATLDALTLRLSQLSNSDFRRAERIIREDILPSLPLPDYWTAMRHLVLFRKAAFITGIMALRRHAQSADFTLLTPESQAFAAAIIAHGNDAVATNSKLPDTISKIINIALPLLTTEAQIQQLFQLFAIDDPPQRILSLVRIESPLIYFVLFKTLKMLPDNSTLVRQCCLHAMRRGNDLSFNMANILRAYFDIRNIPSIPNTVTISTYELSYLDRNYDTFTHILNGRRPKIL